MTQYLWDSQDHHILGMNEMLLENQPTRFRIATAEEVRLHFEVQAARKKSQDTIMSAPAEKASQAAEPKDETMGQMQADEMRAIIDAELVAKLARVARAKKAAAVSKANRDARKAAKAAE